MLKFCYCEQRCTRRSAYDSERLPTPLCRTTILKIRCLLLMTVRYNLLISFATADGNLLPFVRHRADCLHPSTERGLNMQYRHRKGRAAGTKRAFSTILIPYSGLHVVLTLLLVELALLLRSGVLVLLVLGDEIVHVALRLGELHLVHALTGVPVQEGLPPEHPSEVLGHALEHLLDRRGVPRKGHRHLQPLRWDVADPALDVVRDPLHEVRGVLVLHVQHLLVNLLRGHTPTEESGGRKVAPVPRVRGAHHVLRIKHLLRQLRHREGTVLLGATGRERREPGHEEVQPREGDHVHRNLTEIAVQLPGETKAASDAGHRRTHQMVQITVGWSSQLQGAEANIVQRFVIHHEHLVRILHQLMERQDGVVRLHHGVRHLWRRNHGEGAHDPVRVLLTDLGDQQGAHPRPGAPTKGVTELEPLQAVTTLGLLPHHIQDAVDQLGPLGVMTLRPVVPGSRLTEHEIVRTEELTEGARAHAVHGAGLQVHQDRAGDVAPTRGLVVVDIDPLQLQIRVAVVGPSWVDAVLIADHLPELGADLVPALPALDVHELTHGYWRESWNCSVGRCFV